MKFDCIIMNPPYGRLYIPIVKKASEYILTNGKLISLNPLGKFNNAVIFKENLPFKASKIDIIKASDMNKLFGICSWENAGIIEIDKDSNDNYANVEYIIDNLSLIRKIFKSINPFYKQLKTFPSDISLRIYIGLNRNIQDRIYSIGPTKYENACKTHVKSHIKFIHLNTENERLNMYNTFKTNFMRYCGSIHLKLMPFVGDCINPRTGKIGYKSEWTDEDFYKFFDITEEEQKIIEETFKKYSK